MDKVRCEECGSVIDCDCMTCHECHTESTCNTCGFCHIDQWEAGVGLWQTIRIMIRGIFKGGIVMGNILNYLLK